MGRSNKRARSLSQRKWQDGNGDSISSAGGASGFVAAGALHSATRSGTIYNKPPEPPATSGAACLSDDETSASYSEASDSTDGASSEGFASEEPDYGSIGPEATDSSSGSDDGDEDASSSDDSASDCDSDSSHSYDGTTDTSVSACCEWLLTQTGYQCRDCAAKLQAKPSLDETQAKDCRDDPHAAFSNEIAPKQQREMRSGGSSDVFPYLKGFTNRSPEEMARAAEAKSRREQAQKRSNDTSGSWSPFEVADSRSSSPASPAVPAPPRGAPAWFEEEERPCGVVTVHPTPHDVPRFPPRGVWPMARTARRLGSLAAASSSKAGASSSSSFKGGYNAGSDVQISGVKRKERPADDDSDGKEEEGGKKDQQGEKEGREQEGRARGSADAVAAVRAHIASLKAALHALVAQYGSALGTM